jgi:glycosyltransferase involved in cell wall biosynthesis
MAGPLEEARNVLAELRAEAMHIAILLNDLSGGGVERTMLTLAGGFLSRGHGVDLVLARYGGPLAGEVPEGARIVVPDPRGGLVPRLAIARADPAGLGVLARPVLMAKRKRQGEMMPRLPGLVSYLRGERPDVLVSAKYRPNLCAVWARQLARVPTRLVITERTSVSEQFPKTRPNAHHRSVPALMHRYYPRADQIVTVSRDLADDLAAFAAIPRERILAIYNPVVDDRLQKAAAKAPDHAWLRSGDVPVVLGVGRLERRKGFATLIRAFAKVRRLRPLRLVILGAGKTAKGEAADRAVLEALIRDLGVEADVSLPGFKLNPYAYMARASVFVLASDYEGLPGVLIQAMACGCPVVSTDCPTGPREILEGGRFGPLVPVGDDQAMAEAVARVLDAPTPAADLRRRAGDFSVDAAVGTYLAMFEAIGAADLRRQMPTEARYRQSRPMPTSAPAVAQLEEAS